MSLMPLTRPGGRPEFEIPGVVSLCWDGAGKTVVVTWMGPAMPAEFHALLGAEIAALREHSGSRLLTDCRRQPPLRQEDQDRADEQWLPEAVAAGLRRFAVVLPANRDAAVTLEDRLGQVSRDHLEVGFFPTVEAAERWLAGT